MKHELALASAVFFWFPVCLALFGAFPYSGSFLWAMALVPTGITSFGGAILLLSETGVGSTRRYLILPLCLDILAVIAAGLFGLFVLKQFPYGLIGIIWATTLLLLAPCSVAVFFSIPKGSSIRSASIYLTTIISAYSLLTIIFVSYGGFEPMIGLLYIYWIFGMPVIGVCCLLCAIFITENGADL